MRAHRENRIRQAASGVGVAQYCIDQSVRFAQVRQPFGSPIATKQAIQFPLAELATECEMVRLLVRKTAQAHWCVEFVGCETTTSFPYVTSHFGSSSSLS